MRRLVVVGLVVGCSSSEPEPKGQEANGAHVSTSSTSSGEAGLGTGGTGGDGGTHGTAAAGGSAGSSTGMSTGGGGSGGGDGGHGGEVSECNSPADCPGNDLTCAVKACDRGKCVLEPLPVGHQVGVVSECETKVCDGAGDIVSDFAQAGTPTPTQVVGDCLTVVCDGFGTTSDAYEPNDVESDGNDCTVDECSPRGPTSSNSPVGVACATGFCNGSGACLNVKIVLNEISAAPTDWIELHNIGTDPIDISGWSLTDALPANSFTIPNGTIVQGGGYVTFDNGNGVGQFSFGLAADDAVHLYNLDNAEVDVADWASGQAPSASSWARLPNGTGQFATMTPTTKNASNDP